MNKRKEINDKIVEWILNKVKTEYAKDISLVLLYGSYVNGTAGSKSDIDCYYIPKTERGYDFAVDFIIENVGYDIFPLSWDRIKGIADLSENLSPLVGDVRILYSNSASDVDYFRSMQKRLKDNLSNDEYVTEIALKRCETAGEMCDILNCSSSASEIRKLSGNVIMTVADAVAVYNHDYFHRGLKKQFEDLQSSIPNVPKNIVNGYLNVIEAIDIDDVKKYATQLFRDLCTYLNFTYIPKESLTRREHSVNIVNAAQLASFYEEISSTFNKIYSCCEVGNYVLAFLSAVCLQGDLNTAREIGCPVYDLLENFSYTKLPDLSATARLIEADLIRFIERNGGHIKKYDSFEQFLSSKL